MQFIAVLFGYKNYPSMGCMVQRTLLKMAYNYTVEEVCYYYTVT